MQHVTARHSFMTLAMLAIVTTLGSTQVNAEDQDLIPFGEEKFKVSAGGFFANFKSSLKIDATTTEGNTVINVEDDLGLASSNSTFRASGSWRFAPRHRLEVDYYSLDRKGSTELTVDVEWEDNVFPAGTTIDSGLNFDIIPIRYAWSFLKRENVEIAATVGIHWLKINAFISGEAFIGDDLVVAEVAETSPYNGPFPLIGLLVDYQPAKRWQIGASVQFLDVSVSRYRGSILDLRTYAEYTVWRNVALGLSYNFVDMDVTVKDPEFTGEFDIDFNGLLAYVALKF